MLELSKGGRWQDQGNFKADLIMLYAVKSVGVHIYRSTQIYF